MSIQVSAVHSSTQTSDSPMECPACADERCRPLSVTSRMGGVTVQYRCDACGHEWSVDEHRDPLFGRR